MNVAEIDFVARAPDGKEVEELTRKEIIKALRSRTPIEQMFPGTKQTVKAQAQATTPIPQPQQPSKPQLNIQQTRTFPQQQPQRPQVVRKEPEMRQTTSAQRPTILSPSNIVSNLTGKQEVRTTDDILDSDLGVRDISEMQPAQKMDIPSIEGAPSGDAKLMPALDELHNTLRGRLYSETGDVITEVPIRELMQAVEDTKGVYAVVFDGIITQRLVEIAYKAGVKEVYGIRASQITKTYDTMHLYTKEHGRV
jgi:DNA primase